MNQLPPLASLVLGGLLRGLLTAAGGWLAANGTLDAAGQEALIQQGIGGGLFLAGIVWTVWNKRAVKSKVDG